MEKTEERGNEYIVAYNQIPYNVIKDEIEGTTKSEFLEELGKIVNLYRVYDKGAEFTTEGTNGDYVAANLRYKQSKSILNKEARFLFANSPDIVIKAMDIQNKSEREKATELQKLINEVLKKQYFNRKLLMAAKDCFIGKRVALMLNFNDNGIQISFTKSLEFYYETDPCDMDILTKIVTFNRIHDSSNSKEVRIFKKKYWMQDGYCWSSESIFDGTGELIEEITPDTKTLFTYIPAVVILNDGLTGDKKGESEIEELMDNESWYSRLSNADMDAERKSMNPTKYTMDCSPESTENLSTAAGAFWDLQSDPNAVDKQGSTGILEANMSYKEALSSTLSRIKDAMYEQADVPNTTSEALQGIITSGKTLKAIYWGLLVRCDEKMLAWKPALEFMVNTIIEGALLYPNSIEVYSNVNIDMMEYEVTVTNNYPLPEDEEEEKAVDLSEVSNQTMSKKAYMKKWRGLTDEEVDEELKQIALERELLDSSFGNFSADLKVPTENSDTPEKDADSVQQDEEGDLQK